MKFAAEDHGFRTTVSSYWKNHDAVLGVIFKARPTERAELVPSAPGMTFMIAAQRLLDKYYGEIDTIIFRDEIDHAQFVKHMEQDTSVVITKLNEPDSKHHRGS